MELKESLKLLESTINKFEYLLNHQICYLDEHEYELKNQIDIQREILFSNLNKISQSFIDKLALYNENCKINLKKIKKFDIRLLKNDFISFLNQVKENKNELEFSNLIKNIKATTTLAQNEIRKYEDELKMFKIVEFQPVNFVNHKDLFGLFTIKENVNRSTSQVDFKVVKTLTDLSNDKNYLIELIEDNRIAVGCHNGLIKVWNINNAELEQILDKNGHQSAITSLKWLNKSKILISGSKDQSIKLWDLKKAQIIKTLFNQSGTIMALCFNNNYLISASSDNTISIWDIVNFDHVLVLDEHKGSVNDIICSGKLLISCSSDKTIKFWDIESLKCTKSLYGHFSSVVSIQFIPNENNNFLLSYSDDSIMKIWNIIKAECIKILKLCDYPVYEKIIPRMISKNVLIAAHTYQRGKWAFSIRNLADFNPPTKKFKEFKGEVFDLKINYQNGKIFLASWDFSENDNFGCPITLWTVE